MAADHNAIAVEGGGLLRLPPATLRRMRAPVGTEFHPLVAGENLLVMFRENDAVPELSEWVADCALVGRIGAFGIADLFSTLNMGQKTGVLVFEDDATHKRVYFSGGEIVFAVSTDPDHRLGTILVKRGQLKQSQVDEILAEQGNVRLGARLIQKGYLRAKDLYEAVRYQVEEIVYSIFPMSDGIFYFFEGDFLDEDLSQFTLNTQNLLMEGYRRLDEWGVMREQIPHEGVILMRKDEWEPKFDTPAMEKVYEMIDGKKSVKQLMAATGLGEFDAYRAIYDLLRRGGVTAIDPQRAKDEKGDSLRGMVESYNKLYLIIVQALDRARGTEAFSPEQLGEFIGELDERHRRILEGIRFDPKQGYGKDIRRILNNLEKVGGAGTKGGMSKIAGLGDMFKRQQLQGVLDEVLNYLLFTLKNALPPAQADTFIQKVRTAHRRLRERR